MAYQNNLIPPHGGYRKLKSYQTAEIVFDLTAEFCNSFLSDKSNKTYRSYRTYDQMVQAARSGKQNIAEGSQASGTSKKTEIKLLNVARASLEELLLDFEDFLRVNNLSKWPKDLPKALEVRALGYKSNRSYRTYMSYLESAESFANAAICLIHQANFLLDQQLRALEKDFLKNGGFTENLYKKRNEEKKKQALWKGGSWE
ncbi:MAG: four helix bundle suffix domain-containing protein [Patescibacteria group bacterium]